MPSFIVATALWISDWIVIIIDDISAVALVVLSASLRTSSATTANPLPCSFALAASIAAFSASRFVCSAILSITDTISPICSELLPRVSITVAADLTDVAIFCIPCTVASTTFPPLSAVSLAFLENFAISPTFLATSTTEALISSIAEAAWTDCWLWLTEPLSICSAVADNSMAADAAWSVAFLICDTIWYSCPMKELNAAAVWPISSPDFASNRKVRSPSPSDSRNIDSLNLSICFVFSYTRNNTMPINATVQRIPANINNITHKSFLVISSALLWLTSVTAAETASTVSIVSVAWLNHSCPSTG